MLLAMAAATLGLSMVFSGLIASVLFDYSDTRQARIEAALPFNRTFIGCLLAALAGVLIMLPLLRSYVSDRLTLPEGNIHIHWAIMGLWLIGAAFQTFIFAIMVRALGLVLPRRSQARPLAPGQSVAGLGSAVSPQE